MKTRIAALAVFLTVPLFAQTSDPQRKAGLQRLLEEKKKAR